MSDYKFYDLGVICGRFGHEHLGHVSLFEASRKLCKRTLILVGSAQEYGTLRNPFRLETRIDVIKETYPGETEDTLMIRGINDLTNEYDITSDWGKYVKSEIIFHKHKFANLMVYGNDEFRSKWFDPEDLVGTAELIIPRSTLPISGTMIRGMLVIGDEASWQKATPELIHGMYGRLRDELMSVPVYQRIYDQIRRCDDMSLDSFMSVYSEYEQKDKDIKLANIGQDALSKSDMKIVLPSDRFSPVDYFMETCDYESMQVVELTPCAYHRMREDKFLKQLDTDGPWETWVRDKITIEGKEYPPIKYLLLKNPDGRVFVEYIKYGKKEYTYYCIASIKVLIDYEGT